MDYVAFPLHSFSKMEESLKALATVITQEQEVSIPMWERQVCLVMQCFEEVHGTKIPKATLLSWNKLLDPSLEKMRNHGEALKIQKGQRENSLSLVVKLFENLVHLQKKIITPIVLDVL